MLDYITPRKGRTEIGTSYRNFLRNTTRLNIGPIIAQHIYQWYFVFSFLLKNQKFEGKLFSLKKELLKTFFKDDNTLHSFGKHLLRIRQDWIYDMKILLKWFRVNSLK